MSTFTSNLQWTPLSAPLPFQSEPAGVSSCDLPVSIARQLHAIVAQCGSFQQLLQESARLVSSSTACLDFWICKKDQDGKFTNCTSLLNGPHEVQSILKGSIDQLCQAVQLSGELQAELIPGERWRVLAGAPVRVMPDDQAVDLIVAGCFERKNGQDVNPVWITKVAADSANQWIQARAWNRVHKEKRSSDDRLQIYLLLAQSQSLGHAARVLVNSIRRLTAAQQVSLVIDGDLIAVSDLDFVDHRSESTLTLKNACASSLEAGKRVDFQSSSEATDPFQLALQAYCHAHRIDACVSIPLSAPTESDQTRMLGVDLPVSGHRASILIAGNSDLVSSESSLNSLEELVKQLAPPFGVTLRAHRTIAKIGRDWLSTMIRHRWRKIVCATAIGIACILALPMPYRIHCRCEVQPVSKRFIVAPFEGVLEKSLVKNGDVVVQDQLLAQMDGRQLRIELAGLQAELVGARKKFDSELAAGNIAQSQIAKSEAERLKAKINLLIKRTESLEIRSPIDGVVVIGDLEKAQGASLRIGQALFEIAPLDQMYFEVAIPETEIKYAQPQMPVAMKLNAFPYQTWNAEIQLIHPSAEVIDNQNVFVAQALIENEDGSLRPGMKGKAKIKSGWAPLGWSLFHRPWETVRYWTVW
jgi:hypothetical protein